MSNVHKTQFNVVQLRQIVSKSLNHKFLLVSVCLPISYAKQNLLECSSIQVLTIRSNYRSIFSNNESQVERIHERVKKQDQRNN